MTAQILAVACFLLWPLRFSFGQPEVTGAPAFLFAALRAFDQPFNQAPSLHIALAVILWDWYRRLIRARWATTVLNVWTFLICASVLTTWQHHFIDIPTGALLGCICVWLWPIERVVSMPRAWRTSRDPRRWKLAGLYGAGSLLCLAVASIEGGLALWLCWPAASLALVAFCYGGLGARGFQMDSRACMSWAARWLFGPYRFGAAVNARLWTWRLPAAVEVSPGLYLGRLPTPAEWCAAGKPRLVSLCAELQCAIPGVRCVPLLDLVVPSAARLRRAITAVDAVRRTHPSTVAPDCKVAHHTESPVWVACALGFSRSAATVIGWLRLYGEKTSGAAALRPGSEAMSADAHEAVRRARPQIVLHEHWLLALDEATAVKAIP